MGFNKKVLSKAVSELGKAKAPGKPKDIITDPAGQWKYPGQKTRIPGNDITMQDVPYPVWAQPNVGPGSMMQPNQDYNFPGASYVDETPMAKKGGSKLGTINLNPNPLSHYELNYGFNLPTKEDGGEADYEDLELTDEEIQAYRDGGYIVEELPEAQDGGPQNNAGPRNKVEPETIPVGDPWSPDYDLRRFTAEDPMGFEAFSHGKGHATDQYKLPNHPTFSDHTNWADGSVSHGSLYSNTENPGGEWVQKQDGSWNFNTSHANRSNMSDEDLKWYFENVEPGNTLNNNPVKKQGGFVQHELVKAQTGLATTSDSLSLYNNAIKLKGFYDNLKPYYNNPEIESWYGDFWNLKNIQKETLVHPSVSSSNKTIIKNNKNANTFYMSDMITGAIDPKAPLLKYDTRIKPQGQISYQPKRYTFAENVSPDIAKIQKMRTSNAPSYSNSWTTNIVQYGLENDPIKKANYKKKLINIGVALKLKDPEKSIDEWIYRMKKDEEVDKKLPGYITTLPYYDPLAIKPANMLSDNEIKIRFKKYGASGIPQSKLKALGLSSSIQSVELIDKKPVKPVQPVKFVPKPKKPVINNIYQEPVEEITPLKRMSFPQVARPEQQIIPAAPYKKPVRYSGPRYGVLAGDENLDLPEGYTQEQKEAARRKRDSNAFQQKNLEYQQQQRSNKAVVTRKEGGSLEQKIIFSSEEGGCPVGQYWTGTECKIIPKNTKIVYSQDELNKSNVSKKEQQKLYNQYISRINNHAAIDAGREKVYGNKGSKDKYYKTFESIPKSGFDPMMSYGTGQLIPNGLGVGIPALSESMVNFSTWKKMMDKSSIKPIGFKGYPGGGHFYPVYEKPSNYLLGYNKENVTTNIDVVPEDEVTPLKNISYQQSIRPEYEIIPAAPYVKPVHYAGPRHGRWSDGSKGQFPEGLNTSDWERKTKEYQQQQGGTQPVVIRKEGGILDKAQGGKTTYSGPKFGLVGPSTPKNNGSPLLPKQDLIKKYQQEINKEKAIKIAEAERVRQKAIAKQKAINDAIPRGPVSDNTRTVIPNQAISDINNAAFYKSPQETADREARKKEQAAFEKEQWNKYNKMSFAEKALDRTQAAIAHPFLMAGNALAGNQGYIPGMGRGLMNTESPEYDKYLKATGQTKGQFEISDLANIVNPGYWAGNAGNELHKGNYIKGVTDLGLGLMGLKGAKNVSGLVKGSANALNKAESKISKLIPERAPDTSVNTGSTLNAGISPQLIQNAVGPKSNRLLANLLDKAYIGPFFSKTINKYSPLNLIKSYGSKLEGPVKSLGNVLGNSIKNNKLIGGKSLFGKHRGLSTQVGKTNASNIYAAKFDDAVEGSRFQLGEANPQSRFSRKSNATFPIQNKVGDDIYDLPVSDPGVALHRRLPFSNRYVPINKQKLMNNKFQWSTTGAGLQNVAEKYGKNTLLGGLGYGAYNAYNYDENNPETRAEMFAKGAKESYESPVEYVKNPYFVNDIYQALKSAPEEKNGGSIESWEDDLTDDEINALEAAGFIVEELK